MQTLRSLLDVYRLERDVQETSINHLGYAIGKLAKYLGREPDISDFADDTINKFLLWLATNNTRCTTRNYRVRLLTLWRFAVEIGLIDHLPLRVRKVRLSHKSPEAWSYAEVCLLLAHAARVRGLFHSSRVPRAQFWRAIIRCAYDTGLRFGDIMLLTPNDFSNGYVVTTVQHKTGQPIVRWVHPETWEAIVPLLSPDRPRIFGDIVGRRSFFMAFARLAKSAGLRGSFRWLRRTGASLTEREASGSGKKFLGHKTAGLAERHYLDPRLLAGTPVLPPRLVG